MDIYVEKVREDIDLESLKDKPSKPGKKIIAEKKELSENIRNFDKKPRVSSPYDYNVVAFTKKIDYTPTANEMIVNPLYNTVGKFLGIDTVHEWGEQYDKVKKLVDWAEEKTGKKEMNAIMDFLNGALNAAPSFGMNHKRIDQLYLYARMNMGNK